MVEIISSPRFILGLFLKRDYVVLKSLRSMVPGMNRILDYIHRIRNIVCIGPQPDECRVGLFIDFPHHLNLLTLFLQVRLVDTNSVDPNRRNAVVAQGSDSSLKVLADFELIVVKIDRMRSIWIVPFWRKTVEGGVPGI
jgi:hypothetical protein